MWAGTFVGLVFESIPYGTICIVQRRVVSVIYIIRTVPVYCASDRTSGTEWKAAESSSGSPECVPGWGREDTGDEEERCYRVNRGSLPLALGIDLKDRPCTAIEITITKHTQ